MFALRENQVGIVVPESRVVLHGGSVFSILRMSGKAAGTH